MTETAQGGAARSRLFWPGTVAGMFLGGVLLVAVWAKALDPAAFAGQIRIEGLDFLLPARAVALIALALEAGIGLALLLGVRRPAVLIPAALLVAFFLSLTGRAWWMSAHGLRQAESCGCFGNLVQRTPAQAFWQDLLLLGPALLLAFVGRERSAGFPKARLAVVLAAMLGVTLFAWKAPELPLDDFATRLRPGVAVKDLCTGNGGDDRGDVCLDLVAPDLATGRHLVVLADLKDPALGEAVGTLNEYARDGGGVLLLSSSPAEEQRSFFWRFGPAFPVVETPEPLMRPLYRRLPRSFRVEDGKVTATYPGLPPPPAS